MVLLRLAGGKEAKAFREEVPPELIKDGSGRDDAVEKVKIQTDPQTMKKAKPNARSKPKTVEEYLARLPAPARSTLHRMRAMIRAAVPAETTEVLSYGIPTFHYKRRLVAIAAFKDHCSFFPLGASVLDAFKEELMGYRVSKGTLHFPVDKPMPAALVRKIVKARVIQNEGQNKAQNKAQNGKK
jgi:uncharacterized protein YdhG (YjbR/CyaY superfamily)